MLFKTTTGNTLYSFVPSNTFCEPSIPCVPNSLWQKVIRKFSALSRHSLMIVKLGDMENCKRNPVPRGGIISEVRRVTFCYMVPTSDRIGYMKCSMISIFTCKNRRVQSYLDTPDYQSFRLLSDLVRY